MITASAASLPAFGEDGTRIWEIDYENYYLFDDYGIFARPEADAEYMLPEWTNGEYKTYWQMSISNGDINDYRYYIFRQFKNPASMGFVPKEGKENELDEIVDKFVAENESVFTDNIVGIGRYKTEDGYISDCKNVTFASPETAVSAAKQLAEIVRESGTAEDIFFSDNGIANILTDIDDVLDFRTVDKDKVIDYLTDHNIQYDIKTDTDWNLLDMVDSFRVVPADEMGFEEKYELACDIYKETGALFVFFENTFSPQIMNEYTVDILNEIDGDTNENGRLDLADSIKIMQSIANPDKYSLSDKQKFLGDVNDTGDGITALDAQTIQKRLLKLE